MTLNDPTLRRQMADKLLAADGLGGLSLEGLGPSQLRFAAAKTASPQTRLGLRLLAGDTIFVSALDLPAGIRQRLGLADDSVASVTFAGDTVAARGA